MSERSLVKVFGYVVIVLAVGVSTAHAVPPGTTEVKGELDGALYALYVPEGWNGDLVLHAHGFRARQDPIALPDPESPVPPYRSVAPLRDALLGRGYAMALSSYSQNGWAVKEGFFETRRLLPLFISRFEQPSEVYVMGDSMGGLLAVRLAEKHPGLFDGALPMCGAIGGAQFAWDPVLHTRVLFDYFYPDVLPGDALHVPDPYTAVDVYFFAYLAMLSDPRPVPGWWELGQVDGLELSPDPNELFDSILGRIWLQGGTDLLERAGWRSYFDNMDTSYSGSFDDVALNTLVARYEAANPASAYLRRWYEPTGKLRTPTLTLHNAIDGLVPLAHEAVYAGKVANSGYSDNLVQRTVNRYGHCNFTVDEMVDAFEDLVEWVEQGVKPAP